MKAYNHFLSFLFSVFLLWGMSTAVASAQSAEAEKYLKTGVELFSKGNGNEAVQWFTKSAMQGHAEAQYFLSLLYFEGECVLQNDKMAVEWLVKAAMQGHADAQSLLGTCYSDGTGVLKNDKKAAEWFAKAANQGHAEAQCYLGKCYYGGVGVPKDERTAIEWWRKSAMQGYAEAQYLMGGNYYIGVPSAGMSKDYVKAVEWFTKAVNQGHVHAHYNLGVCYAFGFGVRQDYTKAMKLLKVAADKGVSSAGKLLNDLLEYCIGEEEPVNINRDDTIAVDMMQGQRGGVAESTASQEEKVYDVVEVQATYPGGKLAIDKHVAKNLQYPAFVKNSNIRGVVIVRFVIKEDGSVGRIEVVKSLFPECDKAACQVVKTLGKFTPAKQNGRPVAVWYTLPIRF